MDDNLQAMPFVSYKGSTQMDAGLYYCPYIPGVSEIVDEYEKFWLDVEHILQKRYHHRNKLR